MPKTHLIQLGFPTGTELTGLQGGQGQPQPQGSNAWAGGVIVVKTRPLTTFPRRDQLTPGRDQQSPVEPAQQDLMRRARVPKPSLDLSHTRRTKEDMRARYKILPLPSSPCPITSSSSSSKISSSCRLPSQRSGRLPHKV